MKLLRHALPVLALAAVACGDDEIADKKDTVTVLDTFVPVDTSVPPDTFIPPPDTFVPPDTNVVDTFVPDTNVADTRPEITDATGDAADTQVPDTLIQDTVADSRDTTVNDTGADTRDTTVADTGPADTGPQACPPAADETVVQSSTVFTGKNFSGAKDAVKFETDLCSDMPDSAERAYRFDLAAPTEIYAETSCGWDCELILTKDGCDDANVVDCATTLGDEIYAGTLGAGTYRFFIEGDNPEDPGDYDFMLNFNKTGGQTPCNATAINAQNPANCRDPIIGAPRYELVMDNENLAISDADDFYFQDVFACSKDDSHIGGAPDKVYAFTLNGEKDVDINLNPDGWDAMLAVTSAPCGAAAAVVDCSDDLIGGTEELSLTLGAGTWYIVVDGFGEDTFAGDANGAFSLKVSVFDDACND